MSDGYHKTAHVKITEDLLAGLDGEDMAKKANLLTGGALRGEDALKVLRMVMLAALHAPGKSMVVAGFAAHVHDGKLDVSLQGAVATVVVPEDGEEDL